MLDIGWAEMAVIAVLALIVLGPRELPKVLRTVGQWVGKARALAREFQDGINQIAEEAELEDVKRRIDALGNADIKGEIEHSIDPTGEITKTLNSIGESGAEAAPTKEIPAKDIPAPDAGGRAVAEDDSGGAAPGKRTDS